jgi:hypothetical protein
VKGRVLVLLVEEMQVRAEVPLTRTAFGRRNMVADARWYGETWWKEEAVGWRTQNKIITTGGEQQTLDG